MKATNCDLPAGGIGFQVALFVELLLIVVCSLTILSGLLFSVSSPLKKYLPVTFFIAIKIDTASVIKEFVSIIVARIIEI
jgi:hypothetical protein